MNKFLINRHDVLYPSEQSFAIVLRVRLDLACHSLSTEVKGFLLQNFHILTNRGILFTHILPPMPSSYIGETERNLRSRFSECLRSIRMRNNTPELPVAQYFNSTGHSISDVHVCGVGMALCCGTDIQPNSVK